MTRYTQARLLLVIAASASLSACATTGAYPAKADLEAVTEAKPVPPVEILTDPTASDLHASRVEGWGDRVRSAGVRLCRFFERTGMDVSCP
jgi:hypothetical protein